MRFLKAPEDRGIGTLFFRPAAGETESLPIFLHCHGLILGIEGRMLDGQIKVSEISLHRFSACLDRRRFRHTAECRSQVPRLVETLLNTVAHAAARQFSKASSTSTISPISQSRLVTPAAIAGVVRSVLWMRTKL